MSYLASPRPRTPEAIHSLDKTVEWQWANDTITWKSASHPTNEEVAAELTRMQTEWDNNAFQRTRHDAYAEVREQLDLLYHDMAADKVDTTGEWFKAVKAIKDATPKP